MSGTRPTRSPRRISNLPGPNDKAGQQDPAPFQANPPSPQPWADPPEEDPAAEIKNSETLQENPFFTQGLGEIAIFEKTPAIN